MDAVEYFKIKDRMCAAHEEVCDDCPLAIDCFSKELENPEEAVKIVKEWDEKRPRRTRQDVFLKMFPTARKHTSENGKCVLAIPPCELIDGYLPPKPCEEYFCSECFKEFWEEEVNVEVVELVRCGECKWRNDAGRCTYIAQIYPLVAPDHFCKYGKRK